MRFRTIRSNLAAIKSFQSIVYPILDQLRRIRKDRNKISDPDAITVGILDFRDLYRYLHPLLDYSAYSQPALFAAEQVGLEYLFNRKPFSLHIINEYLEEYRLTLRHERLQTLEFGQAPEHSIRKRIIRLDKQKAGMFRKYLGIADTQQKDPEPFRINFQDLPLVDYLFDDVRADILKHGVTHFRTLLDSGVVKIGNRIEGINLTDLQLPEDDDYNSLLERLHRQRPKSKQSNRVDAKAFWLAHKLNSRYKEKGYSFLFVTSSRKVIQAFDTPTLLDHVESPEMRESLSDTSIIRTPAYFLLRLFLESVEFVTLGLSPEGFHQMISRYSSLAEKLEQYFDRSIKVTDLDNYDFIVNYHEAVQLLEQLAPYIDFIAEFGTSRRGGSSLYEAVSNRLKLPSALDESEIVLENIRTRISAALKDPRVVIKHFSSRASTLNTAITELEKGLVPLMYGATIQEFVYPVHTHQTSDKSIQKKAAQIIEHLAGRDQESFSIAFELLGELRSDHPDLPDTNVLCSKVYRSVRAYRDAMQFARAAVAKAPEYPEAHFQLAICYRKIAQQENRVVLFKEAWHHCEEARRLDEDDPRFLRESTYLLWLTVEKKWDFPLKAGDAVATLIDLSRKALAKTPAMPGKQTIVTLNIMNDLAYFLALTGSRANLQEAGELISRAIDAIDRPDAVLQAAFEDTSGFILMEKYRLLEPQQREISALRVAARQIRNAYYADKTSETRQRHYEQVMDLLLEAGVSEKVTERTEG